MADVLPFTRLSVIVPAHNEAPTITASLQRLLGVAHRDLDVIVVDDGSTDATFRLAQEVSAGDPRVRLLRHARRNGKGRAIRTALPFVRGDVVVVHDADLEYDPRDLVNLLRLFQRPEVTVAYGSRWLMRTNPRPWPHYWASRLLSWLAETLYHAHLTDEPTCYKMLRVDLFRSLDLNADGFEFCPEVTAKVLRAGHQIHEAPISYRPRSIAEGKKIRLFDGIRAVAVLLRYRICRPSVLPKFSPRKPVLVSDSLKDVSP